MALPPPCSSHFPSPNETVCGDDGVLFCQSFHDVIPRIYLGFSCLSAFCCLWVFATYFLYPRLGGYSSKVFIYRSGVRTATAECCCPSCVSLHTPPPPLDPPPLPLLPSSSPSSSSFSSFSLTQYGVSGDSSVQLGRHSGDTEHNYELYGKWLYTSSFTYTAGLIGSGTDGQLEP